MRSFPQNGCCSLAKLCPTLCKSVDCSTPGPSVLHCIPEFAQTHDHRVGEAIQPSHPLSSPSPPAFNLSQHQGLVQWVRSWNQVAQVLELQLHHQSFRWNFRFDFLKDGLVGAPCSLRDSQESSPTPQFKSINSSALRPLYGPTLTSIHDCWTNYSLGYYRGWTKWKILIKYDPFMGMKILIKYDCIKKMPIVIYLPAQTEVKFHRQMRIPEDTFGIYYWKLILVAICRGESSTSHESNADKARPRTHPSISLTFLSGVVRVHWQGCFPTLACVSGPASPRD